MKVTVDIDPANMGTVFGSVKKALCDGLEQPEAKQCIDPRSINRATKLIAALEALYSAKNSIEFYHYFGNFIETMGSMSNANSLVSVFGTDPVNDYFQVIAESQYSSIITTAFSNIATLAYNCAEGIHRTKKHANEFRKTHSRKEDISEDSHKSECTEEEPTTKKDEEEYTKFGDFYDLVVDEEEDGTHVRFVFSKEKYDKYWTQFKAREKKYGWDKAKFIIRGL